MSQIFIRQGRPLLSLCTLTLLFAITAATARCSVYQLDDEIYRALQQPLSIELADASPITYSNTATTVDVSNFVRGGKAPYAYSFSLSGALPNHVTLTFSGSTIQIGRNTANAPPTNLTGLVALPEVNITVTDAKGAVATAAYVPKFTYRRVFVTRDSVTGNSANWNGAGNNTANNYVECASGDPVVKANCRCGVAAAAAGLANAAKYRAWLSSFAIDARCNLQSLYDTTCAPNPPQYSGGPWYNMGGAIIAHDAGATNGQGLYGNAILNAITLDESGAGAPHDAWSGTTATGYNKGLSGLVCNSGTVAPAWAFGNGYSAAMGIRTATLNGSAPSWSGLGSIDCGALLGFYCFETD